MLNYKQLHHFWTVAKAGGVLRAAERSGLAPQTLSGQIAALEANIGVTLFRRVGRRLELTEAGRTALAYADRIFQAGAELEEAIRDRERHPAQPLRVGIADVVPKAIAYVLLAPALAQAQALRLICREDKLERLLGELATHRLDLVLADQPMPRTLDVRGHSQLLRASKLAWFACGELADQLQGEFPHCLNGQPLLIPGENAQVRSTLMRWLDEHRIHAPIAGEFDDSALMKAFGQAGVGLFVAPTLIRTQLERQLGARCIGEAEGVVEEYYAITVARRLDHPAIQRIHAASEPVAPERDRSQRAD